MDAAQIKSAREAQERWAFQARVKRASENRPSMAQAQIRRLNGLITGLLRDGRVGTDPKVQNLIGFVKRVRTSGPLPTARMRHILYG